MSTPRSLEKTRAGSAATQQPVDGAHARATRRLRVAVNEGITNRNEEGSDPALATGWINQELTPAALAEWVNRGKAYCPQLSGLRRRSNFLASDILSVDIDGGKTIDEVMANPIAQQCLTIIYTTCRHTPEAPRFRLIFALDRTIESAVEMEAAMRSLALRFGADTSVLDPAHLFFGSRGSRPQFFDRSMPVALLDELIQEGVSAGQEDSAGLSQPASMVSDKRILPDLLVKTPERGAVRPFDMVPVGTAIHCPFHDDENPSAYVVESKRGDKGIHCSTCQQTFWPESTLPAGHDFFGFEEAVKAAHRSLPPAPADAWPELFRPAQLSPPKTEGASLWSADDRAGLSECHVIVASEDYVRLPRIEEGLTFIKSPTGTGKTELLKSVVAREPSTLLIGHRQALINNSCARLDLASYLSFDNERLLSQPRLGICLDSLDRLGPPPDGWATIVIDESEQVLSHFLSETMETGGKDPEEIFQFLWELLRRARRVIALDANLGWVTFDTLTKLVQPTQSVAGHGGSRPAYIYLNERKTHRAIQVFDSEPHLIADLYQAVDDRNRVFVTSNSKERIDALSEGIAHEFGEAVRQLRVTSKTKDRPEVMEFVANPVRRALDYQVILTSPSLGTGVDITFDEQAHLVDAVYGFFDAQITTHFDFDQQLARVRHPGEVKVWITPRRFQFDTTVDVAKSDLMKQNLYKYALTGFDEKFQEIRPATPSKSRFIDMAALITSEERASKNNLKRHFIDLKKHQGCTVEMIEVDPLLSAEGQELKSIGKKISKAKRVERLMAAPSLRRPTFLELKERQRANDEVTELERWSMVRTEIELFYRQALSPELIEADDRGRHRPRAVRFSEILERGEMARAHPHHGDLPHLIAAGAASLPAKRYQKRASDQTIAIYHLLHQTPLMTDGLIQEDVILTNADLGRFASVMLNNKAKIEEILNIAVRRDARYKAIKQLNDLLSLIGLAVKPIKRRRSKKDTIYPYRLDKMRLTELEALVARRRTLGDWQTVYDLHGWDANELDEDCVPSLT